MSRLVLGRGPTMSNAILSKGVSIMGIGMSGLRSTARGATLWQSGHALAVTRYISTHPGPIEPRYHPLSRFVHAQMCAEQMCVGHEQNLSHVRSRYHQLLYYLPLAYIDPIQQPPLSAEVGVGQVAH